MHMHSVKNGDKMLQLQQCYTNKHKVSFCLSNIFNLFSLLIAFVIVACVPHSMVYVAVSALSLAAAAAPGNCPPLRSTTRCPGLQCCWLERLAS